MEVAALACLLNTESTVDVSEQTNGDTGFGAIFNKALGTGQTGKTAQKKTEQQEKTEDDDQPEDAASQIAALLMPGIVGLTAQTGSVNAAAGGQAGIQKLTTEIPLLQTASQEGTAAQPAVTDTEQFMVNVTAQLDTAGHEIQGELTALKTDESAPPQQTTADPVTADKAVLETAQVQEIMQQMPTSRPVPLAEPPELQLRNPGEKQSAAENAAQTETEVSSVQTLAVSTLQSAETDTGDASSESDSAGMEKSSSTEKEKIRSSEKTGSAQTVSPYADLAASKADRETELTQMQEAVNRALDQFEADFQSVKTDGSTIQIALEPKELGSISITLSAGLNGVSAKIQTDNKDAASLISNQVQRMIQAMETKGVRVDSVEIACNQFSQQNFSGGANQYQGQTPSFVPLHVTAQQESNSVTGGYDSAAEQYAPTDGVGQRVEYRI